MVQTPIKIHPPTTDLPKDEEMSSANRRRSPWRRRLVEAERGVTDAFRSDSTLFVHFFLATIVTAAALVFGISQMEWALLIVSFTMVFCAEFFHLAMRAIFRNLSHQYRDTVHAARRIATAGVFCAMAGAGGLVLLVFVPRVWQLFTGQ